MKSESVKEKHRYILVAAWRAVNEAERNSFEKGFYSSMLGVLGEMGYSTAHPKVVKFLDKGFFVLKCTLEGNESVLAALGMIKMVNGENAFFYTLKSSGTLLALGKYYNLIKEKASSLFYPA
ncbi:MAG: Rpp14/Pop5 family protein [Candidatus Micrarchaeia archaeon]